jgi:hypothetical protein
MEPNWAVDHLQVIRTLMERTTLYRRTLAPIMLTIGCLGILAGAIGWWWRLDTSMAFGVFWGTISLSALSLAYLMARRQALKDAEPFWSPPTRRVTQAVLPPFFAGWILTLALFLPRGQELLLAWWLLPIWGILYGCALHAAGFFTPRGMKWFGWVFIFTGCALLVFLSLAEGVPPLRFGHAVMGGMFGGLHLAYGIYLYVTENRKPLT